MELNIFQLRVVNSKFEFLTRIWKKIREQTTSFSTAKGNSIFYEVELVTQKKIFHKNLRVSNSSVKSF